MAYSLAFNLALGASNTGLALEAQLVDTAGVNVGAAITTGFVEIGLGNYLWTGTAIPDAHRGGVKFQLSGGGALKAFSAINPEEAERVDAAVSSRAAAADYTAARAVKLDQLDAAVSSRATPAQVNAEVVDVLDVDVTPEPAAGAPSATPTLRTLLAYLYGAWRNKRTQTSTTQQQFNDAGAALCAATVADDGTTFTRGEMGAP